MGCYSERLKAKSLFTSVEMRATYTHTEDIVRYPSVISSGSKDAITNNEEVVVTDAVV